MVSPKILGDVQRQGVHAVELGHPALQGQAQLSTAPATTFEYQRQWSGREGLSGTPSDMQCHPAPQGQVQLSNLRGGAGQS